MKLQREFSLSKHGRTAVASRWMLMFLVLAPAATVPAAAAPDELPGERFSIDPTALPEPYATDSVANSSRRIERPDGATLRVPQGFRVNIFADDLSHARWMTVASNGDVLLAEPRSDKVTLLRDADGDGTAEARWTFADDLEQPHGLAIEGENLYIADTEGVWRVPYRPGDTAAREEPQRITPDDALGSGSGHWTRNIAFHPRGDRFYVAIGSRGNVGVEPEPRATVKEFRADGSGGRVFASGLRNPVGIAFYPGTEDLYVVVNERDGLGDGLVPDYLTRVEDGGFYGWPYSYIGDNPDPDYGGRRADLIERAIVPDLLFQSHSAPLGLAFYDDGPFPEEYRGGAFVALHGSWNAGVPTGYKVVYVPFANGRPGDHYSNFAVGFWASGVERAEVWGRPAGLTVANDGSLLIADDVGQAVWRISYAP